MNKNDGINLGSIQETMLLPLWGRAMEARKNRPLLVDRKAEEIVEALPYDFATIASNISRLTMASWIARSIFFDRKISEYISLHPDALIVNVGSGMDTTFERVDNGRINWVDLDFPDAIDIRRRFIEETSRRRFLAGSALDQHWYSELGRNEKVLIMLAGVIYYFSGEEVLSLFAAIHRELPGSEVVFDYASVRGVDIANRKVIKKGGMNSNAKLKWGTDNIYDLEQLDHNIKIISTMPMFAEHMKLFPPLKRTGMKISDRLKVMSLAHIHIT